MGAESDGLRSLRIGDVRTQVINVPLRSRFQIAGGDLRSPRNLSRVVIRIEATNGVVGFGEGVALPTVTGTTADGLRGAIRDQLLPVIVGHDCFDLSGLHRRMSSAIRGHEPAKAAVDMAVHDILGRTLGLPVATILGGAARSRVPLTHSIGIGEPDEVAGAALRAHEDGFGVAKLKIDGSPGEAEIVRCVRDAVGPNMRIRLDANAAFQSVDEAMRALNPLLAADIYMIEQPLQPDDLAGMSSLRRMLSPALLADEATGTPREVAAAIAARAADVVNLKTQSAGGLYPAMQAYAVCAANNIPVLVGSRMETGLGSAANVHLMAALGHLPHACDLKAAGTYVSDLVTVGIVVADGSATVPLDSPGLGITVDEGALNEFESP